MMETQDICAIVKEEFSKLKDEIERLFAEQWADPELPAMEYRSSARLVEWLTNNGFEVQRAPAGIPTAFIARRGEQGAPAIAFLAEYDALPGLGNHNQPSRRATSSIAGHGCGHNHIGPANSGAAIIAARVLDRLNIDGEICVVGCPAEEILWGKIALLGAGAFTGIDAILTSHGDYQTGAVSRPCQAVVSAEFVFEGEASHGGLPGSNNALLGAEALIRLVEDARQSRYPDVLVRHVVRRGGIMPTITPEQSRVWFSIRCFDFTRARTIHGEIETLATKAAAETGTQVRHQFISETRGYLPNHAIGKVLDKAMHEVGTQEPSSEDVAFMKELAKACSGQHSFTLENEIRFHDEGEDYYGQDDGEVSWRVPLGRVNWAYPKEIPIHHWAWTALSGHPSSHHGPLAVSQALALAAVRLVIDRALLEAAKHEINQRTLGIEVDMPRIGATKTLTTDPKSFWDATWIE